MEFCKPFTDNSGKKYIKMNNRSKTLDGSKTSIMYLQQNLRMKITRNILILYRL